MRPKLIKNDNFEKKIYYIFENVQAFEFSNDKIKKKNKKKSGSITLVVYSQRV